VRQLEIESFIKNVPDAKPEEYDFLRMEYMKDQFPATTNQEFINNE
jgi:hypothetical protein